MAAGLGSRFGGMKQIAPVDEQGDIIMDFSIFDALRSGFNKIVCVIRPENEKDFDRNTALETIKLIVKLGYRVQAPVKEQALAEKIRQTYSLFKVQLGALTGIVPGSDVTKFEFQMGDKTTFAKIAKLRDDISLLLSVPRVNLTCPDPNQPVFCIEVSNSAFSSLQIS